MTEASLQVPRTRTCCVIISWILFSAYVLSMPWLSWWANNRWFEFDAYTRSEDGRYANKTRQWLNSAEAGREWLNSAEAQNETDDLWYSFFSNFLHEGILRHGSSTGLCTLPAAAITCIDGQNFTELALKYRHKAVGCGCGQGILGEGLCPIDWGAGYTLSTFISTAPGTGAMAALSAVPIMSSWWYIELIKTYYRPSKALASFHWVTMAVFQTFYGIFLICSDCVFPEVHRGSTLIWIAAFTIQSLTTAYISGLRDRIGRIVIVSAMLSCLAASLLHMGTQTLFGVYNYWFGEALSLTIMFGLAPMLLLFVRVETDLGKMGPLETARPMLKRLTTIGFVVPDYGEDDSDESVGDEVDVESEGCN